jgi:hypothetical protein
MAALLVVAIFTVHLPYGFSSIKLLAVTAAGAQFGPPGYESNLLYLACLAALVLGGSGPLAIDGLVRKRRSARRSRSSVSERKRPLRTSVYAAYILVRHPVNPAGFDRHPKRQARTEKS